MSLNGGSGLDINPSSGSSLITNIAITGTTFNGQ